VAGLHFLLVFASFQEPSEREAAVALAIRALASKLEVSESEVEAVHSSEASFRDSNLGCLGGDAEPAVIPGFRVLLEVRGAIHRVHVGAGRAVVCGRPLALAASPLPEAPPESEKPVDPALAPLVEAARRDLASRLQLDLDAIDVVEAKSVVWPDASLGCPMEGMVYPHVTVDGALVRLKHGVATYDYHAGGTRKPFLCEKRKPAGR
jgi:hypothetical protein